VKPYAGFAPRSPLIGITVELHIEPDWIVWHEGDKHPVVLFQPVHEVVEFVRAAIGGTMRFEYGHQYTHLVRACTGNNRAYSPIWIMNLKFCHFSPSIGAASAECGQVLPPELVSASPIPLAPKG